MDILEPDTVWVSGRRYRYFESNFWSNEQTTPYEEHCQPEMNEITPETSENDSIPIEEIDGGKFRHIVDIPSAFYGHIMGCQGATKKKLEMETKTTVRVPYKNSSDPLTITGVTARDIISCRNRMDLLVEKAKIKMPPTHFVSIPLNTEEIIQSYERFRERIVNDPDFKNMRIDEKMFVKPTTLHVTIGMLLLLDEKTTKEAADVLNECVETIVKPIIKGLSKPLVVKIQGVDCMNDDPEKVTVVYGTIPTNETLQEMANKIFQFFIQKQLMKVTYTENVKLHMTLIKSSKVVPIDQRRGSRKIDFNAREILSTFKDYNFGEMELKHLEICHRHSKNDDGSYKTIAKVEL
ncbi:activating signal cointegrator 1 complex subunit 1 [Fopius arisanus]|uniref:Activating signal cointegrator 1 complex subunit 1 n=1 Tax=Fopius arisanus TaxID=64838 RepID=A0A0C9PQ00_9HYME|nr:PREDICTED: activating signal cointegrator 1 complex subunit 1 [Fopius arisanus]